MDPKPRTDLIALRWAAKKHQADAWALQHDRVIGDAAIPTNPTDAMAALLSAWLAYADIYARRYESSIGDDGVLGPAWTEMGEALRTLLNGDIGRLDAGTCDSAIVTALAANNVDVT